MKSEHKRISSLVKKIRSCNYTFIDEAIQDLIDLTKTTDNSYLLHQLELLQIEIERDMIQNKYDTIDECYKKINR